MNDTLLCVKFILKKSSNYLTKFLNYLITSNFNIVKIFYYCLHKLSFINKIIRYYEINVR